MYQSIGHLVKRNNYEVDFLFGCFDKSYGTIKSLVFGYFLSQFMEFHHLPDALLVLQERYDYKTEVLHLVQVHTTFLLLY